MRVKSRKVSEVFLRFHVQYELYDAIVCLGLVSYACSFVACWIAFDFSLGPRVINQAWFMIFNPC